MQCIELFSQVTLHNPSFPVSQYVEVALVNPAPFFCIMITVNAYLKGRFNDCKPFSALAMILLDQSFTFLEVYIVSLRTEPMALFMVVSTSSTRNSSPMS